MENGGDRFGGVNRGLGEQRHMPDGESLLPLYHVSLFSNLLSLLFSDIIL